MKHGIPDRWIPYQNVGKQIEGTRFIAFKVPLKELICRTSSLNWENWFTPNHLLKQVKNLGLVIDLTNTCRFYNPEELKSRNVAYKKLFCMGNQIPSPEVVGEFFSSVDDFLSRNPDPDSLVGVHCTHGVNRTGYLICRYLIEKYGHTSQSAIAAFNEARGHPIERPNYISHLEYVYKDSQRLSLEMERRKRTERSDRSLDDHDRRGSRASASASDSRYRDRPRHSESSHRDRNHERTRSRSPSRRRYSDEHTGPSNEHWHRDNSRRRRSEHSGYDDRDRRRRDSNSSSKQWRRH